MKEIRIDGVIGQGQGEISAEWVRTQLPQNGTDPIRVSIHSEGGSVFEGFAIHDAFAAYTGPKIAAIESTAFSIASYIAMPFDQVEMSPNAYFMLHNPRIEIEGDDEELQTKSQMMSDLKTNMVNAYAGRTGKSPDEIKGILKAETYFNATDAVAIGLADRITQKPVQGRAFARLENMPHGVVTALFGVGSGGDNDSKKGQKMTESTPVAATVQQIKAAFPRAKAEFVLSCIEKSLPMASVATAAAEEMMKENEELKAKVTAMEEEMAKAKAAMEDDEKPEAMEDGEDDDDDEEPKAEYGKDDKKEMAKARAKARGVKPIAKGTSGRPSAAARWKDSIQAKVAAGIPRAQAIMAVDVENPGLRTQYLAEVNAR
jgi:ATP-dependent protease ClpP protease subunit